MTTGEFIYYQNLALLIVQFGLSFLVLVIDVAGISACVWLLRKLWK